MLIMASRKWLLLLCIFPVALDSKLVRMHLKSTKDLEQVNPDGGIQRRSVIKEPLLDFDDWRYYSEVKIGTPPQIFRLLFDTGSDVLWVPSIECNDPECIRHPRFDASKSSTYQLENEEGHNITYISGHGVFGQWGRDSVAVAGVMVENFGFLAGHVETGQFLNGPIGGTLGLSMVFEKKHRTVEPLIYAMYNQGIIEEPVFSVFLESDITGTAGGEIIFGGSDPDLYQGNMDYHQVIQEPSYARGYWYTNLDGIYIEGEKIVSCETGCKALFDTGTFTIKGPQQDVNRIHERLKLVENELFPCAQQNEIPSVTFVIDGKSYVVDSSHFVRKVKQGGEILCTTGFKPHLGQAPVRRRRSIKSLEQNTKENSYLTQPKRETTRKYLLNQRSHGPLKKHVTNAKSIEQQIWKGTNRNVITKREILTSKQNMQSWIRNSEDEDDDFMTEEENVDSENYDEEEEIFDSEDDYEVGGNIDSGHDYVEGGEKDDIEDDDSGESKEVSWDNYEEDDGEDDGVEGPKFTYKDMAEWVLGDPFHFQFFIEYDFGKRRIGIAEARTLPKVA